MARTVMGDGKHRKNVVLDVILFAGATIAAFLVLTVMQG
jgi:hypothetical protein